MQKITKFNHRANQVYDSAPIPPQYASLLEKAYSEAGVEMPEQVKNMIAAPSAASVMEAPSYDGMPTVESNKIIRLMNTGTDEAPRYVPYLADADSGLEIREDVSLLNSSVRCAYYLNCRGVQCSFQPGETEADGTVPIPEFENFVSNENRFTDMPEEAVIKFKGETLFNQTTFRATNTVLIEGSKTVFSDCRNVTLGFGADLKKTTIEASNTDIDLSKLTLTQVRAIEVTLTISGGVLRLPACGLPASWQIIATGTKIYMDNAAMGEAYGLQASNCWIVTQNALGLQKAENCLICFNGTRVDLVDLVGGIYIGNVIQSGTFDNLTETKTGVIFDADICIGNRLNMYPGNMEQGIDCSVCIGNYNGDEVLATSTEGKQSKVFKK